MDTLEIKKQERVLLKQLYLLAARRVVKPSMANSASMNLIFKELYTLTGNEKYLI